MQYIDQRHSWSRRSLSRNTLTNRYEPLQPYILREFVQAFNPDAFLDVGANIGYYSIILSDLVDDIHAFEPVSACHAELLINDKLNEVGMTCHKVGISSKVGKAKMAVISDLSGANAIIDTSIHSDKAIEREEFIETTTLDNLFDFTDSRIVMKIDIEGHEIEALRGAAALLSNNICLIQIELLKETEVIKFLDDLGYKRLIMCGPDGYYSNEDFTETVKTIESAFVRYIEDSKLPALHAPKRVRLLKGVTLEFSERWSKLFSMKK